MPLALAAALVLALGGMGTIDSPQPAQARSEARPRSWDLGPAVHLGAVFGLGVPRPSLGFQGGGGSLGFSARSPRGALVGAGLRMFGHDRDNHRLTRIRVLTGAGYALRIQAFELPISAAFTVEPWVITRDFERVRPQSMSSSGSLPLLGGALSLAPGVHRDITRSISFRMGIRTELAVSVLPDGSAVRVTRDAGVDLFTVGGLELTIAADIGVWFDVPNGH